MKDGPDDGYGHVPGSLGSEMARLCREVQEAAPGALGRAHAASWQADMDERLEEALLRALEATA